MAATANMFWAYGQVGRLEVLCMNSFLANGYAVRLWSYSRMTGAPQGVEAADAAAIIPENRVFRYRNGSYAGFANLFRYALIGRSGGLYADTDVACLRHASRLGEKPFLVTQRAPAQNVLQVNNNVIFNPHPRPGDIMDLALAVTDRFPVEQLKWGDCGPRLLTALVKLYPALAPELKGPEFANSVDPVRCPRDLLAPNGRIDPGAQFLHFYNEMWRRAGVDKEAPYPKGSIMDQLASIYL